MHLLILIKKKDFFSVLTMDRTEKKAAGLRPFLRVQAERRRKSDRLCLARIASAARAGSGGAGSGLGLQSAKASAGKTKAVDYAARSPRPYRAVRDGHDRLFQAKTGGQKEKRR